jgi:DNA-directed RNA polymerase beta subunit
MAEIKSVPDWKCISPKQIAIMMSSKNNSFGYGLWIQIPRLKNPIPVVILFRALGVISDKEICEKIVLDLNNPLYEVFIKEFKASIIEGNNYLNYESAMKYITSNVMYTPMNMDKEQGAIKKREFAEEVLENDLFPHCHNKTQKIYFLGYMIFKLFKCYLKLAPVDDRDSYINKRIDLTGTLLNNLFRNYLNKLVKDMQKYIVREINTGSWKSTEDYSNIINLTNIYKIIKSTTIENGIKRALATGDFGIKQTNSNKVGVAQVLNRLTYISSLSHLRRINTPIDKSGKLVPPRKLHNSSWGFLCPAECFDPETPIMMWSGEIKLAKNIIIGDILIDDLGNPTKVRTTCLGVKNMYDIIPDKSNFIKHRVTDNHILTLYIRQHKNIILCNKKDREERYNVKFFNRETNKIQQKSFKTYDEAENYIYSFNDDNTIDITIEDYLKLDNYTKKHLVLYKTNSIKWATKKVEMDPYLLGMWLGDGLSSGTGFALNYKTDFELLDYWKMWAETNEAIINKDERYKYTICSKKNKEAYYKGLCNRVEEAPLKKYLKKYNLINNKHIPNDYIVNDKNIRLKLLAGIIDTDGHVRDNGREIRICQGPKNYKIIDDIHKIAISLGFSCNVKEGISQWTDKKTNEKKYSSYKEIRITGNNIHEIPTLLPRKKIHKYTDKTLIMRNNSFMTSPFILKEAGLGNYVGWQLEDKKGRFLLDGGLVVHNTPEGASVGVVKNLSYMSTITINSNSTPLLDCVNLEITKIEDCKDNLDNYVKVFINGAWIGVTDEPENLYLSLKDKKYKGIINIYTSVIFDYKNCEIRVCNDGGRLIRPVLKVNNNKILYTPEIINKLEKQELSWNDLLIACNIDDSIIEYIDPLEQSFSMIAMKKNDLVTSKKNNIIYKYTHCEIHPSSIFGILASCIPFPDHNQSPRNTYQCLDINTPVLMKDQSYKLIKDIKVGDYVQTFNPNTMQTSYTKIINQYVRKTDKAMYNVRTYSGKEFNATLDHKFMTYNGWKEVKDLLIDEDLLGIKPALKEMNNIIEENDIQLIFDSNNFRNILTQDNEGKNVNENLVNKYISELENNGLLPLYNNNSKLYILARMYGYALADGTLTYHNRDKTFMLQVDFGDNCGAELFELDIEELGFKRMKIKEGTRLFNGSKYHTFNIAHQNVVGALFKALGMVSGKKTIQYSNDIPNWIKNGTDLVKREFLSGIQGGDGCQIRFNKLDKKGYNYILGPLSMTKNFNHKDSLIKMMTSISNIFNYFKIKNNVFCNLNTNEDDRYNIGIQFSSSQENLINYFDIIGYRYDIRKITKSGIIIEYLKYKKTIIDDYIALVKKIRNYHDRNKSNTVISNELNINITKVSDIIRSYKKNRKITCPNLNNNNNIQDFVNKCRVINDAIFIPIKSKELIDMNIISDITTESDNHSFFINDGIMTHNSAMGKQAMGIYVTNYEKRMDKTAYVLSYPMRPLVDTRIMNIINLNKIPSGEMVIVAIASHTGYNQEDSILFNKGSLDRGLFQATVYHTEKDEDKKIQGDEEIRCKPDPNKTKGMKFANYDKVDQNGVIPENSLVKDRDIIISKILPIKENRNDHTKVIKYEDQSKVYRTKEETYIDKNYIERNGDNTK